MKTILLNILKTIFIPKNLLKSVEGYKTAIGLVLSVAWVVLRIFGVILPDEFLGIFATLIGYGIADKAKRIEDIAKQLKSEMENSDK